MHQNKTTEGGIEEWNECREIVYSFRRHGRGSHLLNRSVSSFVKVPRIIDSERVVGTPKSFSEPVPMTPARLSRGEVSSTIATLAASAVESRSCWRVLEDGTER